MMEKWVKTLQDKLDQLTAALAEVKAALTRLEAQQGEVLQAARGMRPQSTGSGTTQAPRVPETTMQTDPTQQTDPMMRGESQPMQGQTMPGVKPNRPTGRGK